MNVSRSMKEIWEIKDEAGRELEGKTDLEILAYFRDHEPEWAKALPILEETEREGEYSGNTSTGTA